MSAPDHIRKLECCGGYAAHMVGCEAGELRLDTEESLADTEAIMHVEGARERERARAAGMNIDDPTERTP